MTAWRTRWCQPRDWRVGRSTWPQMTVQRLAGHLLVPLALVAVCLALHHPGSAAVWALLGLGLFVVRNHAVAWEVRQGWHDPVYGPMLQRRRQTRHDRLTRPMAVVMGLVLIVLVPVITVLEQHHVIRLPAPRAPTVTLPTVQPLPPCCELSPQTVTHQAWHDMLQATLRVR